ncbi:MAG: YhcH/YjgK/YiaL family protein [Chitinophagaceae bacterium]|jgi:YhcH/YjgK/YiaL family protein|nr:YhcH/YjgK/YiaL family protein [Chitinophagaceae bacterium]
MIIDTLDNAHKYFAVHPLFEQAFAYINKQDLTAAEDGKFTVDGDNLKAIFSNSPGKTAEASTSKFECHNSNIDIQVCITGLETIGWKPRAKCLQPNGDYNAEKDVQLFFDKPDMFFQLTDGQFVIFFPDDVHAPMIGNGNIKKLVMKVKI